MVVTCHWINSSRQLDKTTIAFPPVNIDHTANEICSANEICATFSQVLADYYLMNKIFYVPIYIANVNTTCVELLKLICRPFFDENFSYLSH